MPITMHWTDERQEVFIFDLHQEDWTWHQYDLALDEALCRVKPIEHDFAVIVVSAPVVPEGNPITHLARAGRLQSRYLKLYIIVGGNTFIRTINNIFMRMFPKSRIVFADTEIEALKLAADQGFHADAV